LFAAPQTINGVVFERSACNGARNVSRVRVGDHPSPQVLYT
jgi:hypothetical protein